MSGIPRSTAFLKRLIDVVLASALLLITLPLLALASLLVKLDSPGPVFFRQSRVGRYGLNSPSSSSEPWCLMLKIDSTSSNLMI